jgi:hypothetical protein
MADSYLSYENPSITDAKLDTEQLTVGANTVQRERIQIAGATALQIAPVDGTAGLKVNLGADNDVTVTGTVAATQSGTWNITDISGTVSLPTGAATAAKQPALGTAGTSSADVLTVQGRAAMTPLLVDGSGATQPVSGTVTANAGTDLNTSLLALEAGGNLAAAAASLSVLDDWDETNRAAVNTIAGQVGVQGASGAVTALTQRVVLATDVALPAGTNAIGKLAANSGVDIGDVDVASVAGNVTVVQATASSLNAQAVGNIAHDGADSGNPLKVGMKAIAFGANPTEVAAADRTDCYSTRAGIPFVLGGHMNTISVAAAYTGAETDTAIITAAGGTKIVVTQIQLVASNANSVNVGFYIGFHATTTPTTTGVVLTHPGVAPGSGISRGDGTGILGVGADGDDLRITSSVPSSGSIRVLVSYFTTPS